jgi:hypothetical protein
MIRHMRNIRSITIRRMVSVVEALLLVLVKITLGELDKLFFIEVHSRVVFITTFVTNVIFDV